MCFFNKQPTVDVTPTIKLDSPAPLPPAPRVPDAPKPLEPPKPLEDQATKPRVEYGRKKAEDITARSSGANALRIPLNTGGMSGGSGGLNV